MQGLTDKNLNIQIFSNMIIQFPHSRYRKEIISEHFTKKKSQQVIHLTAILFSVQYNGTECPIWIGIWKVIKGIEIRNV